MAREVQSCWIQHSPPRSHNRYWNDVELAKARGQALANYVLFSYFLAICFPQTLNEEESTGTKVDSRVYLVPWPTPIFIPGSWVSFAIIGCATSGNLLPFL